MPGQRSTHGGRVVGPGLRAAVLIATIGAVCSVTACGSRSASSRLPAYLRTISTRVDATVTAAPDHPQLAIQGATVEVRTSSGSLAATATGPVVPPFVAPPPPQVTATFTVRLAQVHGSVPVRLQDFTIRDQRSQLIHVLYVRGDPRPAAMAALAGSTSFRLTAVLPTGEGVLQWAPGGGSPLVAWDFVVEDD